MENNQEKRITQKQLQSQRTLHAIRRAIDELLNEKSFDQISIKEICGRCNIAVGTFYKYYASKEAILSDRYQQMDDYFEQEVRPAIEGLPLREALLCFAQRYHEYGSNLSVRRQILKARINGTIQEAKSRERPMYTILDELFEQGRREDAVRGDLSAKALSDMFVILLRGYSFNECVYGTPVPEGETLCGHINVWCDALLKN